MKNIYLASILLAFCLHTQSLWAQKPVRLSKNTFGAIEARHIGPATMSGRITSLDALASDPRVLWVGAAGGGVWKSENGGTTFEPVFDKYIQSIGSICIDQQHPDTVWVGTGEPWTRNSTSVGEGIYKTTNGGKSWEKILYLSEEVGFSDIEFMFFEDYQEIQLSDFQICSQDRVNIFNRSKTSKSNLRKYWEENIEERSPFMTIFDILILIDSLIFDAEFQKSKRRKSSQWH